MSRPINGQFALPRPSAAVSPGLLALFDRYVTAWIGDEPQAWPECAALIRSHVPEGPADIAAKLTVALHFADPETSSDDWLAISAPDPIQDLLAVQMKVDAIHEIMELLPPADTPIARAFDLVEESQRASAALPIDAPESVTDPVRERLDSGMEAVRRLPAISTHDFALKLRVCLVTISQSGPDEHSLLTREASDDLPEGGGDVDVVYSIIRDIERRPSVAVRG